jgi:tetratricopeptide (TPR) repeat protein
VNKSIVVSILAAALCALAFWESARIGFARTYALRALSVNGVASAERATQLTPNDAEVHAVHGVVLERLENYSESCREFERAIELRPRDYFLWMMLGVTRDLNDDQQGGLAALRESVRLAPFYAKPRWLVAICFENGQSRKHFSKYDAERDATLLQNVIISRGVHRGMID